METSNLPTEFFAALASADLAAVSRLLAAAPRLAHAHGELAEHGRRSTALQAAVEVHNIDIVKELLRYGADVNDTAVAGGWSPLHLALKQPEMVRLLLEHGAEIDAHALAGLGDEVALRRWLEDAPDAVAQRGPDGATPLHFAATEAVAGLLLDRGAAIDTRDEDHGMTPLEWLAHDRLVSAFLLRRGAAVEHVFTAASVGDVVRMLSFLRADPAAVRKRTGSENYYGAGVSLLHLAARHGHAATMVLLLERGAEVDAQGSWFQVTPLHWAAQYGHADAVRLLLAYGGDPETADDHGRSPADWARYGGYAELESELRSRVR